MDRGSPASQSVSVLSKSERMSVSEMASAAGIYCGSLTELFVVPTCLDARPASLTRLGIVANKQGANPSPTQLVMHWNK